MAELEHRLLELGTLPLVLTSGLWFGDDGWVGARAALSMEAEAASSWRAHRSAMDALSNRLVQLSPSLGEPSVKPQLLEARRAAVRATLAAPRRLPTTWTDSELQAVVDAIGTYADHRMIVDVVRRICSSLPGGAAGRENRVVRRALEGQTRDLLDVLELQLVGCRRTSIAAQLGKSDGELDELLGRARDLLDVVASSATEAGREGLLRALGDELALAPAEDGWRVREPPRDLLAPLPERGSPDHVAIGDLCLLGTSSARRSLMQLGVLMDVDAEHRVASVRLVTTGEELLADDSMRLPTSLTGLPFACVAHARIPATLLIDQVGPTIAMLSGEVLSGLAELTAGWSSRFDSGLPVQGTDDPRSGGLLDLVDVSHKLSADAFHRLAEADDDTDDLLSDDEPDGTLAKVIQLSDYLARAQGAGVIVGALEIEAAVGSPLAGSTTGAYELLPNLRRRLGFGALLTARVEGSELLVALEHLDPDQPPGSITACVQLPDGAIATVDLTGTGDSRHSMAASMTWALENVPDHIGLIVGDRG